MYGTRLTIGLVEYKLKEQGILKDSKLITVKPREIVEIGQFKVEFLRTSHSIADSAALAIHTPVGTVFHSGDFKIDFTPIGGEIADLHRFAQLGEKGVLVMLCDSTNIERPGYTMSERTVGETLTIYSEKRNSEL